jgi:Ca-activated chloride channel family protein
MNRKIQTTAIYSIAMIAFVLLQTSALFAQGILIPHHHHDHWHLPRPIIAPQPQPLPQSYKISEISVDARIEDQVARTQVTQSFVNTGSQQMEVSFVFPLPYDGAIDRMTFMVDGKEYEAKLLQKDEARRIYEGYVRRYKDPALLEWLGTGMFQTSVFPVPAGQKRTVTLRYTQLLKKDNHLTDYVFPLSTAKYTSGPIEKLSFNISIQSSSKIKSIYSPSHAVDIQRGDDMHAVVKYEVSNVVPGSDLRLFFDQAESKIGASLLSYWPEGEEHGYFLLLASPEIKSDKDAIQNKNVIFVIDRSGSMNGKKIEQAKEALKYVVNNLRDGDLFNIIAYDSEIESFKPELQRYNKQTRDDAVGFVNSIFSGGSTNIDGALKTAFSMVHDDSLPNYIVFLTDGLPTVGVTNEMEIAKNSEASNQYGARLISFGVGYDVNSRLIDRLSRANRGQSEYVRPDEDIEVHVSRLYSKIESPVLVDVQIAYEFDQAGKQDKAINRVYPEKIFDLFKGQQAVIVGRYNQHGIAKIKISGTVNKQHQEFVFPSTFNDKSNNEAYAFVSKIWAARRIGEIIDQLDLKGRNQELIDELVGLSIKHGIITPYTSFLADDSAKASELADAPSNAMRASEQLSQLQAESGADAFRQRGSKKDYQMNDKQQSYEVELAKNGNDASGFNGGSNLIAGGTIINSNSSDEVRVTDAVLQVGNETLYRRGNTVIAANASNVDLEKEKANIVYVENFSDEYFKIVAANSKQENELLARQTADQELIVRLRGTIYRFK